jgi:hypothetical protein
MWFSLPYRLEKKNNKLKVRHAVRKRKGKKKWEQVTERGNWRGILDGCIENLGRKVICGHIATHRYGITAGGLDFVHDSLRLLFVEATFVSTMYGGHQHHSFTCKTGQGLLLANDDLCAFLSKEEGRTFTDSLCERTTRVFICLDGLL